MEEGWNVHEERRYNGLPDVSSTRTMEARAWTMQGTAQLIYVESKRTKAIIKKKLYGHQTSKACWEKKADKLD